MAVRGIRGATNVAVDDKSEVLAATRELLVEVLRANDLDVHFDDIVSAIFTTTRDLASAFPAEAARALGMAQVPLLCASEIPVPDSLPRYKETGSWPGCLPTSTSASIPACNSSGWS